MREIIVKIHAEERHCGHCTERKRSFVTGYDFCRLFSDEVKRVSASIYDRCQPCLASEARLKALEKGKEDATSNP